MLTNKFRQQIVFGGRYFCFQTKNNVFVFEQNVFKTQNILLKHRAINLVYVVHSKSNVCFCEKCITFKFKILN